MGVRGLMTYCSSLKRPPNRPRPSRIGIDAFCILYLFRADTAGLESYLRSLLSHGHTLTLVVDRRAVKEKQETVDARRAGRAAAAEAADALAEFTATPDYAELSKAEQAVIQHKLSLQQRDAWRVSGTHIRALAALASTLGIGWQMADAEADETLATMSRAGEVEIVISSDSDLLILGVNTLWLPSANGSHLEISGLEFRRFLGLAGERVYELAFLAGCDVHPRSIAPIPMAVSWLRFYGSLQKIHERFPDKVTESDMIEYTALRAPGACWAPLV
jgi:5'-3' exonuclease